MGAPWQLRSCQTMPERGFFSTAFLVGLGMPRHIKPRDGKGDSKGGWQNAARCQSTLSRLPRIRRQESHRGPFRDCRRSCRSWRVGVTSSNRKEKLQMAMFSPKSFTFCMATGGNIPATKTLWEGPGILRLLTLTHGVRAIRGTAPCPFTSIECKEMHMLPPLG